MEKGSRSMALHEVGELFAAYELRAALLRTRILPFRTEENLKLEFWGS